MRLWIKSLGCKVNLADAARALEGLDPDRWEVVSEPATAEVALLQTCTVTHQAERDVRRILAGLLRSQPALPVVVSGCAAARDPGALAALPNVRAVLPPGDPDAVSRALGSLVAQAPSEAGLQRPGRVGPFGRLHRTRAVVKVQDGCDASCAYCIIPRVRGPERSRPLEQVVSECLRRVVEGHRELVLTGIHLGRWGRGSGAQTALWQLVEGVAAALADQAPDCRLRLSSIEPLEWTAELLDTLARWPSICRHFHVPLQSGSDAVLRAMGRPYRAEQSLEVLTRLRARFPEAALGTDLLVGFPGEGPREAQETLELLARTDLSYLHVFRFSARPGTRAATLPSRPRADEARARSEALLRWGRSRWREFLSAGVARRHRVLLERRVEGGLMGRSEHYRPVWLAAGELVPGQLVEAMGLELGANALRATHLGTAR